MMYTKDELPSDHFAALLVIYRSTAETRRQTKSARSHRVQTK